MDSGYQIKTEIFEGPLDLLLSLIEKRKLHINDISLAKITDDYLAHIEKIESFPLKEAAQFILIASTLVLIKSRSLLPALILTEEEEGDIKNLEARLREYQRVKALSSHVEELFGKNIMFIPPHGFLGEPVFSPTKKVSVEHLFAVIKHILQALPKKEMIPQAIIKKVVSLEEAITALSLRIKQNLTFRFNDLAEGGGGKIGIIVSFLAVLELIRRGAILVSQHNHFGEIEIAHKNESL